MFSTPFCCPNSLCKHHETPTGKFYAKRGYYTPRHSHQPVPRYCCKTCGRGFSAQTFKATYGQRRPEVNEIIKELLCSGVTLRRAARIARVSRRTLSRKLRWLASEARAAHDAFLDSEDIKTSYVQFDEMETYEACKLLPLSIALAVRPKTGQIVNAQVAIMNCHGRMAPVAVASFGKHRDTRRDACIRVMGSIKRVAKTAVTIATDAKQAYRTIIKSCIPNATHVAHKSRVKSGTYDPLFRLNHLCAMLRADLARLSRRTWSATMDSEFLQDHLDLYVAYNNGYPLG